MIIRKNTAIITMLLILAGVVFVPWLSGPQEVYANNYSFEGSCTFKGGDTIEADYDQSKFRKALGKMEPGDTIDCLITYKNKGSFTTDWYMRNSVLKTLEESKDQAENGGYTYVLENIGPGNKETYIFDNSRVGGDRKSGLPEGLKQATYNTGEYFFIQTLKPGQSGKTRLHVAFEGETEVNDYMDTNGKLMLSYAVEKSSANPPDDEPDNPVSSHPVQTGDTGSNIWLYVIINAAALVLLIIGIISFRRDRKGGEADEK